MELLTQRLGTGSKTLSHSQIRRLAAPPPVETSGVQARWWGAKRGEVALRSLVDDHHLDEHPERARDLIGQLLPEFSAVGPVHARVEPIPEDDLDVVFDRPVFVVAAPRAGTTLLHELLSCSPNLWSIDGDTQSIVDGIPSLHLATRGYVSQVLDDRDADPETARIFRAALLAELHSSDGTRYLDLPRNARPRRVRLVETNPENALRIPFLRAVFPDSRFIYLQRDLRQNISSIVECWRHPGFVSIPDLPGWSRQRWSLLLPPRWQCYDGASLTEIACFQWGAANRAILNGLDALLDEDWTTVTYDDLVASPAGEISRLFKFIETEPGPRLTAQLRRPLQLSATTITPPSPIKWKSNRHFDPSMVRSLQPLAGTMRNLRSRGAPQVLRASHPTRVRFACFIDELPSTTQPTNAIVAPSLSPQLGSAVPARLLPTVRHRDRFLQDHPMLWVQDPTFGIWTPLWLRHNQAWLCRRLEPGSPPPIELPELLREQMTHAGVLVDADQIERQRSDGKLQIEFGAVDLERDRYCELPGLLPPALVGAMSSYYHALIDSGGWPIGDAQVERRHGWHNERIGQFMHEQLTAVVAAVARRPLKPTYCFASAYRGGAALNAHTDRQQCDYTLSIMVDETVPPGGRPWALWFESPGGRRSVEQALGGGILFRGCELPHWRDVAPREHEQITLLFHFVPAEWAGVLD